MRGVHKLKVRGGWNCIAMSSSLALVSLVHPERCCKHPQGEVQSCSSPNTLWCAPFIVVSQPTYGMAVGSPWVLKVLLVATSVSIMVWYCGQPHVQIPPQILSTWKRGKSLVDLIMCPWSRVHSFRIALLFEYKLCSPVLEMADGQCYLWWSWDLQISISESCDIKGRKEGLYLSIVTA